MNSNHFVHRYFTLYGKNSIRHQFHRNLGTASISNHILHRKKCTVLTEPYCSVDY